MSAITLRSRKELQDASYEQEKQVAQEPIDSESSPVHSEEPVAQRQASAETPAQSEAIPTHKADQKVRFHIPPPFPKRFERTQKDKGEREILETFRKVKINIPPARCYQADFQVRKISERIVY